MTKTTTLASKVARNAEFAGFGPCVAVTPFTVKCHHQGRIHTVKVPSLVPHLIYGNPVDPALQATFCLLRDVYGSAAYHPDVTEIKFTPKITTKTHYLWLTDFDENQRLVLVELLIEGVPMWHRTYTLPYDAKVDPSRWDQIATLFDNYLSTVRHSDPQGITEELLRGCSDAAKVRAGKEA